MTQPVQSQSRQQTLQQQRAADAWNNIQVIVNGRYEDRKRKEYGSLVRGLPAMIITDGLGQTLAFLLAKGKGEASSCHILAYKHVSAWVSAWDGQPANTDLLQLVLNGSTAKYRQYTSESLAYLHWLKRFAEAQGWQSDEQDR